MYHINAIINETFREKKINSNNNNLRIARGMITLLMNVLSALEWNWV